VPTAEQVRQDPGRGHGRGQEQWQVSRVVSSRKRGNGQEDGAVGCPKTGILSEKGADHSGTA
jgi:hypothetical protein